GERNGTCGDELAGLPIPGSHGHQSSGLKPDARTIAPQRAVSDLINRANSSGEVPPASNASFANPDLTVLLFSASRIAALSLSTMAAGVGAGPTIRNHPLPWSSGKPASLAVGTSAARALRCWPVTTSARSFPDCTWGSAVEIGLIEAASCPPMTSWIERA